MYYVCMYVYIYIYYILLFLRLVARNLKREHPKPMLNKCLDGFLCVNSLCCRRFCMSLDYEPKNSNSTHRMAPYTWCIHGVLYSYLLSWLGKRVFMLDLLYAGLGSMRQQKQYLQVGHNEVQL